MAENPTLEGKEQPKGQIDIEAFIGELTKMNVTKVEDLQGMATASKQAGHLANLLGEANQKIAELSAKINNVQPVQKLNLDNAQEGQTINLEGVIENVMDRVLTKKEQEARDRQGKLQKAITEAVNVITNDEDYTLVKEVWEKQMTPDMILKIQTGQVNPIKLYQETVRGFYKKYLKQSEEVILQLTGKGKVAIPHVESGEQKPGNLISQNQNPISPAQKRLSELKEQVNKGKILSDAEELEMAGLVFSTGGQPKK